MAHYPEAPMPPPPGWGAQRGPPHGPVHVDDWRDRPVAEVVRDEDDRDGRFVDPADELLQFDVGDEPKRSKKDKKDKDKSGKNTPVELRYEGYMLHKITPDAGAKPSWARVGKRAIPNDSDTLYARAMDHRKKTGMGPVTYFQRLSPNQQGVVDRLVTQRKSEEKDKNADWILYDVAKVEKTVRLGLLRNGRETVALRVILKRQDKNLTKSTDKTARSAEMTYEKYDIIDLTQPLQEKKESKKDKKKKRDDGLDGLVDVDDPLADLGIDDIPPPPREGSRHREHSEHRERRAEMPPYPEDPWAGQRPVDPFAQQGGPPPGAIPVHGYPQQPYHPNPFQPNPEFGRPEQFSWRPDDDDDDDSRARSRPRPRVRTRSPAARRRSSTRRASEERRRSRAIENRLEDINAKIDRMNMANDESSEGTRDSASVWSPAPSGRSFTPPSTPPQSPKFREPRPRGSLQRRMSSGDPRGPGYLPRYRGDRRYRDERVEIEPAYSYRSDRDRARYLPERRYSEARRPPLLHANTYDSDYPDNRAEPRYVPQRRLTNFAEAHDEADWEVPRRDRRDSGIDYTRVNASRRESRVSDIAYAAARDAAERIGREERRRSRQYYI